MAIQKHLDVSSPFVFLSLRTLRTNKQQINNKINYPYPVKRKYGHNKNPASATTAVLTPLTLIKPARDLANPSGIG